MKIPPTLADRLYMLTSQKDWIYQEREHLRTALFQARRFMLDDQMSAFLCDLSMARFFKPGREIECDSIEGRVAFPTPHCSQRVAHIRLDQLRLGARVPHAPFTWIEFNLSAFKHRAEELGHEPPSLYSKVLHPNREGWLILTKDELCQASMFLLASTVEDDSDWVYAFPWSYAWSTNDNPVGSLFVLEQHDPKYWAERAGFWERALGTPLSAVAAGIPAYKTDKVEVMRSMFNQKYLEKDLSVMVDWAGCLRRIWAFLSTVNDIPVLRREVKATKGFMARHSYKRFLDHHTIHLNVPEKKDLRVLARHVLAAVRKRAHMVRGHWRKDWRHLPSQLCEHEWNAQGVCKVCQGHRLWIHEHQRGDPSLGVTLTDYAIHN